MLIYCKKTIAFIKTAHGKQRRMNGKFRMTRLTLIVICGPVIRCLLSHLDRNL